MAVRDNIISILNLLSNGQIWSMHDLARECECSYSTVRNCIEALSTKYPITYIRGGINRGGVQLDRSCIYQGKIFSKDKLQIISKALELLQSSSDNIEELKLIKELLSDFGISTKSEDLSECRNGKHTYTEETLQI